MPVSTPSSAVRASLRTAALQLHHLRAARLFRNAHTYIAALREAGDQLVELETRDGLRIAIRPNVWDARIVRETFFDRPYLRHFPQTPSPVVVDVGAYIGDFSLYAAHYLGARVVAYEPTQENREMLEHNIQLNGREADIRVCPRAVGTASELTLSVERRDQEIHASSYLYGQGERRTVPCDRLEDVVSRHALNRVDLLKIDCEGGEYDILLHSPASVFSRIENIVFEAHAIESYRQKLEDTRERLAALGYRVRNQGMIFYANRVVDGSVRSRGVARLAGESLATKVNGGGWECPSQKLVHG